VPIFQEQAMKIAIDAARFSAAEANQLRKAMATFRSKGNIELLQEKMVGRMVERGYDPISPSAVSTRSRASANTAFPKATRRASPTSSTCRAG
jgi:error-prone DNA polymerase